MNGSTKIINEKALEIKSKAMGNTLHEAIQLAKKVNKKSKSMGIKDVVFIREDRK